MIFEIVGVSGTGRISMCGGPPGGDAGWMLRHSAIYPAIDLTETSSWMRTADAMAMATATGAIDSQY
jgi:hypothetical protein